MDASPKGDDGVRRVLVRAASAPTGTVKLSVIDQMFVQVPGVVTFFYDGSFDDAVLERGFAQALGAAPEFAARMRAGEDGFFIVSENQGALFTSARSELDLPGAVRSVDGRGHLLTEAFSPPEVCRGAAPLLAVRVTHLADGGTVLGFSWSHALGDLQSLMVLMRAWSAVIDGRPLVPAAQVPDRAAHLDARLPPGGAREPGLRVLSDEEMQGFGQFLATAAQKKRLVQSFFAEAELARMRDSFCADGTRLSSNDFLCAHLMEAIHACDPVVERRNLSMVMNYRKLAGLEENLLGNPLTGLVVGCDRAEPAKALAVRIREGRTRFLDDHLDYRATTRFLAGLGGVRALPRCSLKGMDPAGRHVSVTNVSGLGVYTMDFFGTRPVFYATILDTPFPWVTQISEGFEGQGRLYSAVLPNEVADRWEQPEHLARLHRFRQPGDAVPGLGRRVGIIN